MPATELPQYRETTAMAINMMHSPMGVFKDTGLVLDDNFQENISPMDLLKNIWN